MSALVAAATLSEMSGWTLTNLQLQKMLYLAQMFHMGENGGKPIFPEDFEAWKLGPVQPALYRRAKIYGNKPVENLFIKERLPEGSGKEIISRMLDEITDRRPWRLVSITHWDGGAWAKNYDDGDFGSVIPKEDILDEYRARADAHAAKVAAN